MVELVLVGLPCKGVLLGGEASQSGGVRGKYQRGRRGREGGGVGRVFVKSWIL